MYKGRKLKKYLKRLKNRARSRREEIISETNDYIKKNNHKKHKINPGALILALLAGVPIALEIKGYVKEEKPEAKIELNKGDIVEFCTTNYELETLSEVDREWVKCKTVDDGENEGYVPIEDVDIYIPYEVHDDLNGNLRIRTNSGLDKTIIAEAQPGSTLYVFQDGEEIDEEDDNHNWEKVLYYDSDEETYIQGYAAIDEEYAQKDEIQEKCFGIINEDTTLEAEIELNKDGTDEINQDSVLGDDEIQYVLDLSEYGEPGSTEVEEFKELVNQDKIGGVIFQIGGSNIDACTNQYRLKNLVDNPEEYDENNKVEELLQGGYNQIDEKINLSYSQGMGDIKNLEEYIKIAMEADIPIGFYFYSTSITEDQTSAEAAYINNAFEKLKNDIPGFEDYINNKMLSFVIDIETTDSDPLHEDVYKAADHEIKARTKAAINLAKLLGEGTDDSSYWCIDGVSPKEGYNIVDKEHGVMIYRDFNREADGSYADFDEIKKELEDDGYKVSDHLTRAIKQYESYTSITEMLNEYDDEAIVELMMDNEWYNINRTEADMAEIMQCRLDITVNGQGYDINIATKKTIDSLVNGNGGNEIDKTTSDDKDEQGFLTGLCELAGVDVDR